MLICIFLAHEVQCGAQDLYRFRHDAGESHSPAVFSLISAYILQVSGVPFLVTLITNQRFFQSFTVLSTTAAALIDTKMGQGKHPFSGCLFNFRLPCPIHLLLFNFQIVQLVGFFFFNFNFVLSKVWACNQQDSLANVSLLSQQFYFFILFYMLLFIFI